MKREPLQSHRRCRLAARGLTFIELMFATIILGLGAIIIASVFPVAIGEQRATIDATTVADIERGAARTLDAAVSVTLPGAKWLTEPADPKSVISFAGTNDPLIPGKMMWERFQNDMIDAADARYGWAALYQRGPAAATAADTPGVAIFYIFSLVSQNAASFTPENQDFAPLATRFDYTVMPGNDPDLVRVLDNVDVACEGAFIVRNGTTDPAVSLASQSPVIKLGNARTDIDNQTYEVAPGFEILGATSFTNAQGWMMGRSRTKAPADPLYGPFTGAASGPCTVHSCQPVEVRIPYPG